MVAVASQIDSGSEQFAANRASMMTFVERLRALEKRAQGASAKRRATFEKRGQLIPSDRLNRLLDPGMPFLRLHTLANFGVDNPDQDTSIPGASVMVGIGFVGGARCMIWVDDSGIAAGAMTGKTGEVALSLQTICKRQKLPLIHLVESAGAKLLRQQGAQRVIACATHAVFSPPACERLSTEGLFEQVVVTNSIPIASERTFPQLKVLSVANMLGEAILRIHHESSVSSMFR